MLGEDQQRIIATWLIKVAMVIEFGDGAPSTPQSQRTYLMEKLAPPEGWSICIANYEGRRWETTAVRKSAFIGNFGGKPKALQPEDAKARNIQSLTFGVGRLVTQIFSTALPGAKFNIPPDLEAIAPQIWPFKQFIYWPPRMTLDEDTANRLHTGFNQMLGFNFDPLS